MGGIGSSRWQDHERPMTVEEVFIELSVSVFTRRGIVKRGHSSGLIKSSPTAPAGWRWSLAADTDRGRLWISALSTGRPRHLSPTVIELTTTRPNYGGLRWWFRCPRCRRRTAWVCIPREDLPFGCRTCHGLKYTSQRRDRLQRLLQKRDQVWRRVGDVNRYPVSAVWPDKPKGMHWKTYDRLGDQWHWLENEALRVWLPGATALLRGIGLDPGAV